MSLFGLGSFGEGFVTGFATEANEALKKSVNRINTRVDKLKQFQVERAIKEQDKRASEIEEHKEALAEAYALFGGDENAEQAIAYAGGLLKERGGLAAFKSRIAELREAKDNNVDINSYFGRAETDAPYNATLDDIAEAAVGGRSTLASDYRLPKGMGDDSSLIGTVLGKKIDVVGMAMEQAGEEIRALYGADVDTLVKLPTITFKAEEFSLRDKSPAERLEYANKKLALPRVQADEALKSKYTNMRDEQELAVINTKDEAATIKILDAQINRAEPGSDEEATLLSQRKNVNRNMQLKAVADQPVKELNLRIEYAMADALEESERTGNPIDRSQVKILEQELASLTGDVPSVQSEIDEEREELRRRSDPSYTGTDKLTIGSDEYDKELARIEARQNAHDSVEPLEPLNPNLVDVFQDTFLKAIKRAEIDAIKQFSDTEQTVYQDIKDLAKTSKELERLRQKGRDDAKSGNNALNERLAIYDKVAAASDSVTNIVIARSLNNYNKKDHPEAWVAAAGLGYIDPADATSIPTATDTSAQTAAALGGKTPAAVTDTTVDKTQEVRNAYSDDAAGANKMVNDLLRKGIPIQAALDDAKAKGYKNPEFISILEAELGTDSAIAKMAIEDTAIEVEPDRPYANAKQIAALKTIRNMPFLQKGSQRLKVREVSSKLNISEDEAKTIVESLDTVTYSTQDEIKIAKDIVDSIMGTDYREIKVIAEELNIPMDYAKRLHKQVTGNSASTGGLMARR